jgi:hypothetical protein
MFHHEHMRKAEPFGFLHIVNEILIAMAIAKADRTLCARPSKQTKAHRMTLLIRKRYFGASRRCGKEVFRVVFLEKSSGLGPGRLPVRPKPAQT